MKELLEKIRAANNGSCIYHCSPDSETYQALYSRAVKIAKNNIRNVSDDTIYFESGGFIRFVTSLNTESI